MVSQQFEQRARALIDNLKAICANYGLGNDGNEFKIITQVFLYKFLCDKFAFVSKQSLPALAASSTPFATAIAALDADSLEMLYMQNGAGTPRLAPQQLAASLYNSQAQANFARLFDDTLIDIAQANSAIFAVQTDGGAKITLFERISEFIADPARRDDFCRAIINKLADFSFEHLFGEKYDFYAALFEYLIKDYNKDSGGKYAEYYTPHAVAKIMAAILVPPAQRGQVKNVSCYDPSAGSGTLLMNLAHAIGEDRCAIYSQDISQKSSSLLRLNLILNGLVASIPNIIQGNTIAHPYHRETGGAPAGAGQALKQFDYIVSNPPFKMDFSDFRDSLDTPANRSRFFAGIPNIPKSAKDKMAIYLLFLQHIIASLKPGGKAAVVVPTGFITAQSGIDKAIRQHLVDHKMLTGVVSMPAKIFATTGTNVSILFIGASQQDEVVLIDASKLGEQVKDGKNQKTLLSEAEENRIIDTFNAKQAVDDFSVCVSYADIAAKNYSLSAGQYFQVKLAYSSLTPAEFAAKLQGYQSQLDELFAESAGLEREIQAQLKGLRYEA